MSKQGQPARARFEALWQAWAQRKGWPARLLWPVAQVALALNAVRQLAYARGWLKSDRLAVPVIVVGNVVVGGAGKTPTVMALVQHLQRRGWTPGVVSRGYGRASDVLVLVDGATTPAEAGDEPLLIHRATGAPVCVARQRVAAGRALLARHPQVDVIVCDDGLQHLALARDLSIAVFDERGVGNGWLLPAGLLREPWPPRASSRYQPSLLLVQRREGAGPPELASAGLPSFDAERRLADQVRNLVGEHRPLSALLGQPFTAVAGIARPSAFFNMVRARGISVVREAPLPDHAGESAYRDLLARHVGPLICTEKDAVKLMRLLPEDGRVPKQNIWVAPLELRPEPGFFVAVDEALATRSSRLKRPADA